MSKISTCMNWLLRGIPGDIRSAFVGAVVGSLISTIVVLWAAHGQVTVILDSNDGGFGTPVTLFDAAEDEGNVELIFEPMELRNIYVCEAITVKGNSYRDALFNYLERYRDCFSWTRLASDSDSPTRYSIRANPHSGETFQQQSSGDFFCKCRI